MKRQSLQHEQAVCPLWRGVARYAAGEPREGYRPGAPLVWCLVCLQEVNADFNVSRVIGQRLVACVQPVVQEKPPARPPLDRAAKAAGVASSHAAAGSGGSNRDGTTAAYPSLPIPAIESL